MDRLEGKVALVSGAARGQGEAEARLFAAEGAQVVLGDVLDDLGEKVAVDIGEAARYVHLDVTEPAQWRDAVDGALAAFGRLDCLVNNAGILRLGMLETLPLEEYLGVVQINQVGCFLGMQAVVAAMKGGGGGSIINTSSVSGMVGMVGLTAYTATKFAIRGMTKVAALELGAHGIRVNSVHPGAIDTAMIDLPEFGNIDKSVVYGTLPVPRIGRPDDVAQLMVYLASDESSYCTGAEFVIDGGFTTGSPVRGMRD